MGLVLGVIRASMGALATNFTKRAAFYLSETNMNLISNLLLSLYSLIFIVFIGWNSVSLFSAFIFLLLGFNRTFLVVGVSKLFKGEATPITFNAFLIFGAPIIFIWDIFRGNNILTLGTVFSITLIISLVILLFVRLETKINKYYFITLGSYVFDVILLTLLLEDIGVMQIIFLKTIISSVFVFIQNPRIDTSPGQLKGMKAIFTGQTIAFVAQVLAIVAININPTLAYIGFNTKFIILLLSGKSFKEENNSIKISKSLVTMGMLLTLLVVILNFL